MLSNNLILCRPLLLPSSVFPSIRVFSNESVLCIRWPKYWSFGFSISPSNEYSGIFRTRWWIKRTCAHLLMRELQNCNSMLNNHWQENVGSYLKTITQGQRRSPNKMVGVKSHLESNPIPTRDAQRPQTKPYVHQDPGTPQETEPDLPLCVSLSPAEPRVSSDLLQGQRLRLQQTWVTQHVA